MARMCSEEAGLLSGTHCEPLVDVEGSPLVPAAPATNARRGRPLALAAAAGTLGLAALLLAAAAVLGREGANSPQLALSHRKFIGAQEVYQTDALQPTSDVGYATAQTAATPYATAGATSDPYAAGAATAATDPYAATAAQSSATGYSATAGYGSTAGYGATSGYGYVVNTTAAPYTGPLEFKGNGGPPAIAGTKLISAGIDDAGSEGDYPHDPAPTPPPEYYQENPPLTMYMYRAQSDTNYPMRNVNTGDLAGVLWYLHNEIVAFPDPDYRIRHFNITRIIRFKVTILNPPRFYERHHTKFGAYVAFGAGKCSVPNCDSIWRTYGAVVGCQAADTKVANYRSAWKTQSPESQCTDGCNAPLWFSLPGPCPSHEYGAKTASCVWDFPGGDCGRGSDVTGAEDCTYYAKWYGEVRLDELLNFTFSDGRKAKFSDFMAMGGVEYDKVTDRGVYTSFWDGIHDEEAGRTRVETVRYWFNKKYPRYPTELQETDILCDFNGWHGGEFSPLPAPGR